MNAIFRRARSPPADRGGIDCGGLSAISGCAACKDQAIQRADRRRFLPRPVSQRRYLHHLRCIDIRPDLVVRTMSTSPANFAHDWEFERKARATSKSPMQSPKRFKTRKRLVGTEMMSKSSWSECLDTMFGNQI